MIGSILNRLKANKLRTVNSPSARPRLRLESLEGREVPAANYWLGGDGDFTKASNWSNGLPAASNDLYFDGSVSGMNAGFYVGPKQYPPGSNPSYYVFPSSYAGVHIVNGYSGTLQFQSNMTFGTYEQRSGTTSNGSTQGLTTTVTTSLSWTGGTINSGQLGYFNLASGATGTVDPDSQGVSTGSTITLLGNAATMAGSAVEFLAGTVNWLGGSGLVVNEYATAEIEPQLTAAVTFVKSATNSSGKVTINENGKVLIHLDPDTPRPSGNTDTVQFDGQNMSIDNNGGTLKVYDRVDAKLTGDGALNFYSVAQTAGTTQLEAGSGFTVTHGMRYSGGKFEVKNLPGVTIQPTANINGSLYLRDTAVLNMPDNVYGTLSISSLLDWAGGEIRMAIGKKNGNPIGDQIVVGGNVVITNTPKLTIRWTSDVPGMPKNTSWDLIRTTGANSTITGIISLQFQDPLGSLTFDWSISGNQKSLFVRKTSDPS
jgi:hypothetical protein